MVSLGKLPKVVALLALGLAIGGGQAAAQTTQIKVASTSKEIFDNLPFFVGKDSGIFKKHGLDVEVTHFSGGGEVVRAVSSGSMQFGMVATTAAIIAAGGGQKLKIISAWSAPAYGIYWVVPTDSPLKTVKDLAGKKVGISRPGSVTHTGLLAALQNAGLKDKVEIVPVGSPGDSWTALKNNRVQASWHTAPDVYGLLDRREARVLMKIDEHLRDYQQGALIAMSDYLSKNGEIAKKFIRASAETIALIDSKPADAAKMGAKATGMSEQLMLRTIKEMPKGFFRTGAPRPEHFKGSLAEAVGTGALKQTPSYDGLVDRAYLP